MDKITKKEIAEAENQLFLAQLASNVDGLNLLLYDDLVAVAPDGQMLTKEMDLNAHRSKAMIIENASTEIDEIRIIGDTALSVTTMTAKGKVMGAPLEGKFRYFRVWKRIDNTLKVIGASFMQLP
ncbi:nuclear transport factor 2 family protein [Sphingobacterium sp.]|uniref:nuclear transport factor 2 family protein n=1 Tax=Sphingobacterium sp. TaxID=341027 RepID=UPI0025895678|nr:nuclear transport factor 2 family protein [Sphingobacterium sp.]WET66956.1 MAG: nuclear transport factor 2 family protein [Sphingobacterium sp.]